MSKDEKFHGHVVLKYSFLIRCSNARNVFFEVEKPLVYEHIFLNFEYIKIMIV